MKYIFKFPDIGEGLDEGTIAEWYVKKGQAVEMGESLVKMETDKVVTDIPSPKTGIIANIFGKEGETIHVGDPLVEIDLPGIEGKQAQEELEKEIREPIKEEGAGVVGTMEIANSAAFLPATDEGMQEENKDQVPAKKKKALATPVARAMAKSYDLDIDLIAGTGPAGRVMKEDILQYQKSGQKFQSTANPSIPAKEEFPTEVLPLSQIRKTIAKNMVHSKQNAAHMSLFDEVEITELIEIRKRFKEKFAKEGIKLSYLPFILKATAMALKEHPTLNSEMNLDAGQMILKKYYNLGVAVDTDDGLVVPVIRNVDQLSIKEIAQAVGNMAEKARNRELGLDDMRKGSFTLTSFGSIGGQFAVPVINYPQAAILGIGRIMKKPVVRNEEIVPGNILPLSISVDHRIVDGGEVSRFINRIMEFLSDPVSLIMG